MVLMGGWVRGVVVDLLHNFNVFICEFVLLICRSHR
jgi:hypothetical protein